jgi:hypothetical protein
MRPYPGGTVSAGLRKRHRESGTPLGTFGRGAHQAPDGTGFSSRSSSRAGDRRCPSRSGWGEAPAASDRGGRCRAIGANSFEARPLARDISTGLRSKGRVAIRSSSDYRKVPAREKSCACGRPRVWSCGVRAVSVVLTKTYRLQKLAVGVWPIAPTSEEHVDHDDGSSPLARERRESETAPEAGLTAVKPQHRWRVPVYMWVPRKRPHGSNLPMEGVLDRESRPH